MQVRDKNRGACKKKHRWQEIAILDMGVFLVLESDQGPLRGLWSQILIWIVVLQVVGRVSLPVLCYILSYPAEMWVGP